MLYQKHIIIAIVMLVIVGGLWFAGSSAPVSTETQQPTASSTSPSENEQENTLKPSATTTPAKTENKPVSKPAPTTPARIQLIGTTDFKFDIVQGETPCGTKIGTVEIVSSDPTKELYWGFTGSQPIWLSFSEVVGKTPTKVDLTFNCILSGAEDTIDWSFTVVEKTKDGKWVDGYSRRFSIKGDIR